MRELKVTVRDKIATADGQTVVCGNSDYTVHFDLDAEWDAYETKTMRVVNHDRTYTDVVFTGIEAPLPVVVNQSAIRVGLFAGDLHTSTPAYFPCELSILCGTGTPADPTPDVYNQIIALLDSKSGGSGGLTEAQVNALDNLFKYAAYTKDASSEYSAFRAAFGLSGGDEPSVETWSITNTLTNATNSNSATTVEKSGSYSATITIDAGCTLSNITVTMGGVDITSTAYGDGYITIGSVTGDVIITVVAVKTTLYQLSDVPRSVSGLNEDTGISFGSETANGYTDALTICCAYTGFDASETLMKMSGGVAMGVSTNGAGSNTLIRIMACNNVGTVEPSASSAGDYRFVITKEAKSEKTVKAHTLNSSGEVSTVDIVGVYGKFFTSENAGNLLVGSSDITVNALVIYKGILSDEQISAFLAGGEL